MVLPRVVAVAPGSFHRWLAARNKLGDQHKVPRASNQRDVIEAVLAGAPTLEPARDAGPTRLAASASSLQGGAIRGSSAHRDTRPMVCVGSRASMRRQGRWPGLPALVVSILFCTPSASPQEALRPQDFRTAAMFQLVVQASSVLRPGPSTIVAK